jgi:8-oxo-dGTP pyrophosphatase MutT (NUDIX family)
MPPIISSTIIVLRENIQKAFDIFLLKRSGQSVFMGNNFVYPGGVVDEQDSDSVLIVCCNKYAPKEELFPFMAAGIRELFEEGGILLAYDKKGHLLQIDNEKSQKKFGRYRALLYERKITLHALLRQEELSLAADRLCHYAHWITPIARPMRFDTHFFVARCPDGQTASPDRLETSEGLWMTPFEALEENLKGAITLSPPTLATLEELSRFTTVNEVFAYAKDKDKSPVLPVFVPTPGQSFVVFPWDPDYVRFRDGDIPHLIDHGRPSSLSDMTTRILLKDGVSIPYCKRQ